MRFFHYCFIIQTLLLKSILSSAIIELPDLVRASDETISVSFSCNDKDYEKIGKLAFNIHGAYRLVKPKQSDYMIQMVLLADTSVGLRILDGTSVVHESKANLKDTYKSFLHLLDKVIEITGSSQNLEGIYSGRFAFVGKRDDASELYLSDIFFNKIQQITSDEALLTRPNWSPDGKHLVFTSYYKSGFPDLFEINLATRERSTVAAFKGTNTGGVYSPSGDKIAMTLSNDGNSDLYTLNLSNRNLKRIMKSKSLESNPSWSPDGKQLVFVSDSMGSPQLYIINSSGGSSKRIKTSLSRYCTEPDWNPIYEDLIVFTASIGGRFQIAMHSLKTGKSTKLTSVDGGAMQPTWMPDGRHIAFTERLNGSTRLVLLDTVSKKSSPLHSMSFGSVSGGAYFKEGN